MKKQNWFTMVELFGVVLILGIVISMGVRRFWNMGTERYHAERCVNQIYREISNFYSEAAGAKISSDQQEAPEAYIIATIDDKNYPNRWHGTNRYITWFNLYYRFNNGNIIKRKSLTFWEIKECGHTPTRDYIVVSDSSIGTMRFLPNLQWKWNKTGFLLLGKIAAIAEENQNYQNTIASDWSDYNQLRIHQGTINFDICKRKNKSSANIYNNISCTDFSKILFDARTWLIKRSTCKEYKTDDKEVCKERTTELE